MLTNIIRISIALLTAMPAIAFAAGTVQLPATGQTSCYNSQGDVIPCTGTGQDGEKRVGVAWPAPRFTDNLNGTLTDKLTGLIWSKHANAPDGALANACPNAEEDMSWQQALDFVKCLNSSSYLGFSDWRLPSLTELESMTNAGAADISAWLNSNGFGQPGLPKSLVRSSGYWTSTSDASDTSFQSAASAWDIDFAKGDFSFSSAKIVVDPFLDTRRVWPVRGASTGPARLWQSGQKVCFDASGAQISCTGSGQDGEKLAGAAWPVTRFKTNVGGTLALDRLTGLVWATDTESPGPSACSGSELLLSWQEALDHVKCLNQSTYSGVADWRLPNRKELRSLADSSKGAPALPAGHPFLDEEGNTLWSSTTDASSPSKAWAVSLFDGSLNGADKTNLLQALPVSGPDLAAPVLSIIQGNMSTKAASQTISGTVETGATVNVTNNGTPVATVVTGTTWSSTIDPLTTGLNNVIVSAADFSENISTAAISITLDAVAPSLLINSVTTPTKAASQTVSGTMEAGATVSVKLGATVMPVTISGTTWSTEITNLAEGANTITVSASDAAGNTSTLPPVIITLDTIPPVTTATTDSGNYFDSVAVTLAASEAGSTIYYTTDGSAVTTASPVYSAPVRLAATTTTSFTLRFMAVDQAGNAEPAKSAAYTVQVGCDFNGDNKVDVSDALKALQITIGLSSPTSEEKKRGDVAPLVNGKPAPDGIIDIRDTLVILQRSVGLLSPW